MGIFKQMKEMKATVAAAPDLFDQAPGTLQQSPPLVVTEQAATLPGRGPDFEPIAGVSLELYAQISKGLAEYGYDQARAVDVAASKGVIESDWTAAVDGWNARLRANPTVSQRFSALYTAA